MRCHYSTRHRHRPDHRQTAGLVFVLVDCVDYRYILVDFYRDDRRPSYIHHYRLRVFRHACYAKKHAAVDSDYMAMTRKNLMTHLVYLDCELRLSLLTD